MTRGLLTVLPDPTVRGGARVVRRGQERMR